VPLTTDHVQEGATKETRWRPGAFGFELLALAIYAVTVAGALRFHEPWADEAQAWLIARSLPLRQMFQILRYEGTPGLWHLLLWCLIKLHVSYVGMGWAAGAIAVAGAATLLLFSPFPRWLRLLLPFSFFLVFQYAVVARSYVLGPALLFLLAALWSKRFAWPVRVAVVLGLMANVALHLAMFAGGFALVFALELAWFHSEKAQLPSARKISLAALVLILFCACAIVMARPAKDIAYPQGLSPMPAAETRSRERLTSLRHGHSLRAIEYQFDQWLRPPLADGLVLPLGLALLFWTTFAWALLREGKLRYLIPGVLFALFCHFVAVRLWHAGLMTQYVIAVLWMTWPQQGRRFGGRARHEQCVLILFLLVVLLQIDWAVYALRFDRARAYSPGRQTATFLRPYVDKGARILETGNHFDSVAIEPYFEQKVFANEPYAFHWWSTRNHAQDDYSSMVKQHPELVLVQWLGDGDTEPSQEVIDLIPEVRELRALGYRNSHIFCGAMPVQGAIVFESHCELVFQPSPGEAK
jgi:hypothetical protein